MPTPLTIAYSEGYLKWLLGPGDGSHPTNPIRAQIATEKLVERLGDQVRVVEPVWTAATREAVESIHDPSYVSAVVDDGRSSEWTGLKTELGETALLMFEGTKVLVEQMIAGDTTVAFNPQGAKHHAHFDHAFGFCVFNDMAWAAKTFAAEGLKPVYIDWDAHAGDGVQHLLIDTDIPTMSIHNGRNFPYDPTMAEPGNSETHTWHNKKQHAYNWALAEGSGDNDLVASVSEALAIASDYSPDVVLLAIGADGHHTDPLGALAFDYPGYKEVAGMVAEFAKIHCKSRVLIGGAGGYQPETETPEVWATVVATIFQSLDTKS
jgi:acetoin utilization protein AcuC